MAAKSSPLVLGSHLQEILDIGFGRWSKVDPLLARTACTALQRLHEDDKKRLLQSSGGRVFGILESLISGFWLSDKIWFSAADKAITAIYAIHPTPETVAVDLIKRSLDSVFGRSANDSVADGVANLDFNTVQVSKLSRFLFVVSHLALNQLVYIESCVRRIQKQRAKKEKMESDSQEGYTPAATPSDTLEVR